MPGPTRRGRVASYFDELGRREWRSVDYKRVGCALLLGVKVRDEFVARVRARASEVAASLVRRVEEAGPHDVPNVHNAVVDFKKWSDAPIENESLLRRKMDALSDVQVLMRGASSFADVKRFYERHGDVFPEAIREWRRRVDETRAALALKIESLGEYDFCAALRLRDEIEHFRTYSDVSIDDSKVSRVANRAAHVAPFRLSCSHKN